MQVSQYLISGAGAQVEIQSPKRHPSCGWASIASWSSELRHSASPNLRSAAASLTTGGLWHISFFPVTIQVPWVPKCLLWGKCRSAETLTALSSYALCPCLNHNRPSPAKRSPSSLPVEPGWKICAQDVFGSGLTQKTAVGGNEPSSQTTFTINIHLCTKTNTIIDDF